MLLVEYPYMFRISVISDRENSKYNMLACTATLVRPEYSCLYQALLVSVVGVGGIFY